MPNIKTRTLREEARRLAESSRREQGLDPYITDPVVLGKIAAIFKAPLSSREEQELMQERNDLKEWEN